MAPLFYTDSLADIRDILVFGEDMTNEDEEKQKELEKAEEKQEKIEEKTEKGSTKVWARNWRHDHFILEVVCEVHFMQQIQLAKQQPLTVLVAKNDAHQMVYCLYWVE